jgi:NAD(P)-dependent dehydrogenase (short-subunit alcohol dehydrogenase family)
MTSWLLTGPSQAFGPELIRQLLARGDRVAAITDQPEDVAAVHREYGDAVWVRAARGNDVDQLRATVSAAFTDLGRIEVVVSNAMYGLVGAAEEFTDADVVALITTNLTGAIRLARTVVPHLRAQGGGRLMQVSSMAGQTALPGLSLYHATKWGIEGFFEAFGPEVEPFGIHTTLVEPGMVRALFPTAIRSVPLGVYADNPAIMRGDVPVEAMAGDHVKIVEAVIETARLARPPRRLLLGTDAYEMVHASVRSRLEEVERQQQSASRSDFPGWVPEGRTNRTARRE